MKLLLLWLLPMLGYFPAAGPSAVHVTFSPLTKAAYLAAKKAAVSSKPVMTFPLKKVRGRIVIPTAKGSKVFQDKGVGTDSDDQELYEYAGYHPQFRYHLIIGHFWERTNWFLLGPVGLPLELYDAPLYSPDLKNFVVISAGIEFEVYPNEIRLFQFENARWRQSWKLEPSVEPATWAPDEILWLSNTTLLLKKKMYTGPNPGTTFTYAKLTIR